VLVVTPPPADIETAWLASTFIFELSFIDNAMLI